MSHDQANKNEPNPNYDEGVRNGYYFNCQSCVVAYEMRRRGYDVEALMRVVGDKENAPEQLAHRTQSAWIDPSTGVEPKKQKCGGANFINLDTGKTTYKTFDEITEELNFATGVPGRYHVDWYWKGRQDGHIIVAERFENNGLRFYDAQTGEIVQWAKLREDINIAAGINVLRVDKLMLNEEIACNVVKRKH